MQIDNHEFLYISPKPTLLTILCGIDPGLSDFSVSISGLVHITVPNGCTAMTGLLRFTAMSDLFTNTINVKYIDHWNSSFIGLDFTHDDYESITNSLLPTNSTLSVLSIRQAYNIKRASLAPFHLPHFLFTSGTALATAVIFAIILYLWCSHSGNCCHLLQRNVNRQDPIGHDVNINLAPLPLPGPPFPDSDEASAPLNPNKESP